MSSNVINFAQVLNARRANAAIQERTAAALETAKVEKARIAEEIAADLGGSPAAQVLGGLVAQVASEQKAAEQANRFLPAYCDPSNEVRGSKFDATRGLGSAEVAARIRADIKAAQKAGRITAGCKISVRKSSYSGGWSVDVRVMALPDGFRVTSPRYASWLKQFGRNSVRSVPMAWQDCKSEEANALEAALSAIVASYNRDNSDSSVDYFDVRFHSSVGIDWQVRDALEAAEVEASPGDVWHESADH